MQLKLYSMKKITFKLLFCFLALQNLSFGQITAVTDNFIIPGIASGPCLNVLENDYLDAATLTPATSSNVSVTNISGLPISPDGTINCAILPGTYNFQYQICEIANPTNCSSIIFGTLAVQHYVQAFPDSVSIYSDTTITIPSVKLNDTVDGVYDPGMSFFWTTTSTYPEITLNPDGTVDILPGLAPGSYYFDYYVETTMIPFGNTSYSSLYIEVLPSITLSVLGTYSDFNSDSYTSVGDVIDYQYTVSNIGVVPINTVTISSPTGSGVLGSPIAVLNGGVSDGTTFTERYLITQNDINTGGFVLKLGSANGFSVYGVQNIGASTTNSLSISDGIKLNAFFDTNGDGFQNIGEANLNIGKFTYQINSGVIHDITSSSGIHYLYESNPSTSYNLGYVLDPAFTTNFALSTTSYPSVTVASGSGITTYNFPIVASVLFNDLSVNIIPSWWNAPRPGFAFNNTIKYTNHSNQTMPAGTVSFNCDSAISILSTSPTPTTLTATNFTFDFVNLLPFESRYINVTMQVPVIPTVSLGQLVTNTVSIIPNVGDTTPLNNTSSMTQTIVGAYDPNDKMESHGEQILHSSFTSNDYLTYTIQFENTGTANAVNVRLNDVLDAQLDETSIKVIDTSHPYFLDRVGTNLNFRFDAIDLPPSVVDTSIGKGYVVFQVKPKPGYAVGDIIPNTANIYFDFNPAIVTNTFLTEFVSVLNSDSFTSNQTIIFPNPTSNILNIESKNTISTIEIMDINGRSLLSKKQKTTSTSINVESLSNGIYFVKVTSENGDFVQKFVKI
jgi:uncharacterized repeat protein (TIGR01451 family)